MCFFSKYGCGSSLHQYTMVSDLPVKCGNNSTSRLPYFWSKYKKPVLIMLVISVQFLFSSFLWNYFMINYNLILETNPYAGDVNLMSMTKTQNDIFKSSAMWMVSYFWRLVNPQTMTQVQLVAILYNKECDLVLNTQIIGFLSSGIVAFGSYTHLKYATHLVKVAAFS